MKDLTTLRHPQCHWMAILLLLDSNNWMEILLLPKTTLYSIWMEILRFIPDNIWTTVELPNLHNNIVMADVYATHP